MTAVPLARAAATTTTWRPQVPVDVRRTLSPLRRGGGDPTHRVTDDGAVWRTSRLASGADRKSVV